MAERPSSRLHSLVYLLVGVVLLVVPLFYLAQWPDHAPRATLHLRVVTSLGAALIGAALPGLLRVRMPGVRAVGAAAFFAVVFLLDPPTSLQDDGDVAPPPFPTGTIVVGAKDFPESSIAAEMFAQVLKARTDRLVDVRHSVGESAYVFNALRRGDLHVYPEYTGTILSEHLNRAPDQARDGSLHKTAKINDLLARNSSTSQLKFIGSIGVNNPYVLVMRREVATSLGLEPDGTTLERLADAMRSAAPTRRLRFGSSYGFFIRADGFKGLVEEYGLEFAPDTVTLTHAQKMDALRTGQVDVTDFYGTDPALYGDQSAEYTRLKDNRGFFPDYHLGALVHDSLLSDVPEAEDALRTLRGVSNEDMATLIGSMEEKGVTVDGLGRRSTDRTALTVIVKDYLEKRRLLE